MTRISLLLGAFALLPAAASAQTETGNIDVTASVAAVVAFSDPSPLAFGSIIPNTLTTVAPADGGQILLTYNVTASVTAAGTPLTGVGAFSIPVTYSCAQDADENAAAPSAFTCATGYDTIVVADAPTERWFYIGGEISGASTAAAPAGDYEGLVTLTATFDAF